MLQMRDQQTRVKWHAKRYPESNGLRNGSGTQRAQPPFPGTLPKSNDLLNKNRLTNNKTILLNIIHHLFNKLQVFVKQIYDLLNK